MPDDSLLLSALRAIQARGAIGESSLEQAIVHAEQFVAALPLQVSTLVDLGSGGGLPGLVIAVRRPEIHVTLVERRQSRADLLARAIRALDLTDRVSVVAEDVRLVGESTPNNFDAVTARSFAAPAITAHWAGVLLRAGGRLVVSEPPVEDADRWPRELLAASGLIDQGREQGVRVFRKS
ncbi:MAG: class I SAM-dependent methyltransferase [Ilumatobacteraceae bacterium]|nr:class I SAM-dependent methyltransferase [Ilumatobacteraceae bacterium]